LAIWCNVIPCSVILFSDESGENIFHQLLLCCEKSHCLQQHRVPAIVKKYFFAEVYAPLSAT
jgi:hypothetical protein